MSILEPIIVRNAARCRACGDVVESRHRHDYRTCSCGKVSVDGGHAYLRRCGEIEHCEDLSEVVEPSVEQVQSRLQARVDHAIEWRDRLRIPTADWERKAIDQAIAWLRDRGIAARGLDDAASDGEPG